MYIVDHKFPYATWIAFQDDVPEDITYYNIRDCFELQTKVDSAHAVLLL